ncbi:MAG: hypothetical protein KDA32_05795 [Phycisphaerales bacterium]|nr:hypothetical protein [Phycisphaerales bacterium]
MEAENVLKLLVTLRDALRANVPIDLSNDDLDVGPYSVGRIRDYVCCLVDGMACLFEQPQLQVCAIPLARTAFESATRVLWAAVTPDGWNRLAAYLINVDITWANSVSAFSSDPDATFARNLRDTRKAQLCELNLDSVDDVPSFEQIVREIASRNEGMGNTLAKEHAHYQYNQVYRLQSRYVHGSVLLPDTDDPGFSPIAVGAGAALACFAVMRAYWVITSLESSEVAFKAEAEVVEMLQALTT